MVIQWLILIVVVFPIETNMTTLIDSVIYMAEWTNATYQ